MVAAVLDWAVRNLEKTTTLITRIIIVLEDVLATVLIH